MLFVLSSLPCTVHIFQYNGANIQLLDLPGIIEGASKGKMFKILNKGVHLTNYENNYSIESYFFLMKKDIHFVNLKKQKSIYFLFYIHAESPKYIMISLKSSEFAIKKQWSKILNCVYFIL